MRRSSSHYPTVSGDYLKATWHNGTWHTRIYYTILHGSRQFLHSTAHFRDMKLSSELQSGVDEKDLYLKEEGGVIVQVLG